MSKVKTFVEFLNESLQFEDYEATTALHNMDAVIDGYRSGGDGPDDYKEVMASTKAGFDAVSKKLGTSLDKIVYLSTTEGEEREFLEYLFPRFYWMSKDNKTIWKDEPVGDPTSHNRITTFMYKDIVFCEWSGSNWDGESLYVSGERLVEYMLKEKKADTVFRVDRLRHFFMKFVTPELAQKYRGLITGSKYGV